jgi:hypothetical protein
MEEINSRWHGEKIRRFGGEDPTVKERIRWRWEGMGPTEFYHVSKG